MTEPITSITTEEQKKLKDVIIGYGNLAKASRESGVPEQTLRRIALTGIGTERYVNIIRQKLIGEARLEDVSQ